MNTTPAQSSLDTETQVRLRRAWGSIGAVIVVRTAEVATSKSSALTPDGLC